MRRHLPLRSGDRSYTQILPSNSVNLGWSSWAILWLSRVPAPVPDHVAVAYSTDEAVRVAYTKQAAQDWHEFIAFRGRELCPGGRLVVMTMALDENGEFGYRPLMNGMAEVLGELAATGLITEDEMHRMCIPIVGRRAADFAAPSRRRDALSVWRSSISKCSMPRTGFGRSTNWTRTQGFRRTLGRIRQSLGIRRAGKRADGGCNDRRSEQFSDRLEAGIAERLAAAPEQMQIPMAQLVLIKRPKT